MSDNYRYIGSTPTDLDGGRPIEPGEFTGAIEISDETPKNQHLLDDGLLLKVPTQAETDVEELTAQEQLASPPAATATGKDGEKK